MKALLNQTDYSVEGLTMKKLSLVVSLLVVTLFVAACAPVEEGDRVANLSFATSGQGGTFFVAGAGIAALVTDNVEGLTLNAEVTLGVVENARLLASGETEMGFSYGSVAYNVQRGLQEFQGQQYGGIRAVANIHDAPLNIVTLQRSDLTTLDDLIGRKVSIGPRGSGSASVAEEFLTAIGLFDLIDIQYLSFNDSASSIRDGFIDAFIIGGSSPIPALIELESTNPIRLIPVDPARIALFLEQFPYHAEITIPAGIYTTVTQPVTTVGYTVIFVAREDVPEWVIYEMLTEMFSSPGRTYLQNVQLAFREMTAGVERFKNIDLPLHPGAERYYREQGLLN